MTTDEKIPTAARRAAEGWANQVHQLDRDGYTAGDVRRSASAAFLAGVRWARANPEWVSVEADSPPGSGYYPIVKRLMPEDKLVCSAAYWDGEEWETIYVVTHWHPQLPLSTKEQP